MKSYFFIYLFGAIVFSLLAGLGYTILGFEFVVVVLLVVILTKVTIGDK